MLKLFYQPEQIVTVDTEGKNYKRGKELDSVSLLTGYSIAVTDGKITGFVKNEEVKIEDYDEIIDLNGKTVLPGLIDCHTHTAYAGSRADEFKQKLSGVDYEDIARQGGGINATVQAVRKSSFEELVEIIKPRIDYFISQGVTTLEIKSGYGLSYYDEIKLLKVIKEMDKLFPINIVSTFLGAHTFPPEYKNDTQKYISIITDELIPYIAEHKLADFCDGFCETTAFSANDIDGILKKASGLGLKIKLHTDQFNNVGGIEVALKNNSVSMDHLEVVNEDDIQKVADSDTVVVLLPGVSFFLDYGYAPARKLIDGNAIVALSTDFNPGSSHIANINLIMSLAALKMKMTIEETISAFTINAAKALDLQESTGSLEIGKCADFAVLDTDNYADLVYQVGKNLNVMTVKSGEIIYQV